MPRIGQRELKFALEEFWAGRTSLDELEAAAAAICRRNWTLLAEAVVYFLKPVATAFPRARLRR